MTDVSRKAPLPTFVHNKDVSDINEHSLFAEDIIQVVNSKNASLK